MIFCKSWYLDAFLGTSKSPKREKHKRGEEENKSFKKQNHISAPCYNISIWIYKEPTSSEVNNVNPDKKNVTFWLNLL